MVSRRQQILSRCGGGETVSLGSSWRRLLFRRRRPTVSARRDIPDAKRHHALTRSVSFEVALFSDQQTMISPGNPHIVRPSPPISDTKLDRDVCFSRGKRQINSATSISVSEGERFTALRGESGRGERSPSLTLIEVAQFFMRFSRGKRSVMQNL